MKQFTNRQQTSKTLSMKTDFPTVLQSDLNSRWPSVLPCSFSTALFSTSMNSRSASRYLPCFRYDAAYTVTTHTTQPAKINGKSDSPTTWKPTSIWFQLNISKY